MRYEAQEDSGTRFKGIAGARNEREIFIYVVWCTRIERNL